MAGQLASIQVWVEKSLVKEREEEKDRCQTTSVEKKHRHAKKFLLSQVVLN